MKTTATLPAGWARRRRPLFYGPVKLIDGVVAIAEADFATDEPVCVTGTLGDSAAEDPQPIFSAQRPCRFATECRMPAGQIDALFDTISAPVTMAMGPNLPTLRFVCFHGPDDEVLELIEQPAP